MYNKEKMNDLISIIVPVYQSVNTLGRCIDSILAQTYINIEVIIVDDGSTDGSGELCDQYKNNHKQISVIHTSNNGPVSARKKGLEKASGKYIGFVDADDYIEPDLYEQLGNYISECQADFVHSFFWSIKNGNRYLAVSPYCEQYIINNDDEKQNALDKLFFEQATRLSPSIWSKLYNAEFIKSNFSLIPDNLIFGEDVLLLYACICNARCIRVVDICSYNYFI